MRIIFGMRFIEEGGRKGYRFSRAPINVYRRALYYSWDTGDFYRTFYV